jgi:rubrerythrin
MVVAETFAGLGALKTAFDIAKGLKDIDDTVRRNAAVIELQEKILAAREAQSALLDRVSELEEKVAKFETWNTEKQKYELKDLGGGASAYMLKPDARGAEPPTWVCTNCYEHNHKATLQCIIHPREGQIWICPSCKNKINPSDYTVKWID